MDGFFHGKPYKKLMIWSVITTVLGGPHILFAKIFWVHSQPQPPQPRRPHGGVGWHEDCVPRASWLQASYRVTKRSEAIRAIFFGWFIAFFFNQKRTFPNLKCSFWYIVIKLEELHPSKKWQSLQHVPLDKNPASPK